MALSLTRAAVNAATTEHRRSPYRTKVTSLPRKVSHGPSKA
jgi:hypothetical protein